MVDMTKLDLELWRKFCNTPDPEAVAEHWLNEERRAIESLLANRNEKRPVRVRFRRAEKAKEQQDN